MMLAWVIGGLGFMMIFYGVWRIHKMKEAGQADMGGEFFKHPTYKKKRWSYTIPSMLGLVFLWGAAATTVPVVSLSSFKVFKVEPSRMEVTITINKQRNCLIDSLTITSDFKSGRREIMTIDYPSWAPSREIPLSPDVVETVINKNDESRINRIGFSAKYTCPFGFHLDAPLGEVLPPDMFNQDSNEQT